MICSVCRFERIHTDPITSGSGRVRRVDPEVVPLTAADHDRVDRRRRDVTSVRRDHVQLVKVDGDDEGRGVCGVDDPEAILSPVGHVEPL